MVNRESLIAARLQCHHAVQLNTKLARAFVPAREDDSHTTLMWEAAQRALIGEAVAMGGTRLRLGLVVGELALVILHESGASVLHELDGLTVDDAVDWLAGQGIDRAAIEKPLHFELEDHPLLHGGRFRRKGLETALETLSGDYSLAASLLERVREARGGPPVRCWPHHFDIATLLPVAGGSVGVGMSPGDVNYSEPYYYVSPWPPPPVERLPLLKSKAFWHTENWVGAVLTSDRIAEDDGRPGIVQEFLDDAVKMLT